MLHYHAGVRKSSFCLILASLAFALLPSVFAQAPALEPVITGPDEIKVGRTLVLDASASKGLGEDTQYRWYVQGIPQPISRTVEVVYTPEKTDKLAIRLVISTKINGEAAEAETQRVIVVYERKIALIADASIPMDKLLLHQENAANEGVYLRVLQPPAAALPVSTEDSLYGIISEKSSALAGAQSIIIWTDGISGLQALMRSAEENDDVAAGLENQTIALITERSLNTLSRTARGPFSVLKPERILITRKEAVNPLITSEKLEDFLLQLEQRDIDITTVDKSSVAIRPWNLLSALVSFMLTHGISSQIIILLLTLPLITSIIAFLKQVIGITTFGLFTPSIVALSFLAVGWRIGIAYLVFLLITGNAVRTLLNRWRLLHIPKVAIILTVVSITLLILMGIGAAFDFTIGRDTVFILLIMSTLSESFLAMKAEEGWTGALIGVGETILAAIICVIIVSRPIVQSILLAYPEVILLTIIIDIGLGKWTGLRLVEYFRFREVFRHLQEE